MESTTDTYAPLGGRRHFEATDSPDIESSGPPKDRNYIVYVALLSAGIGFVLPYNSFIIASDYWQDRFPGRSVALDMSMTYIIVAFATVIFNNVFLSIAPFRIRIACGYAISFTTLIFVAICEVAWHLFTSQTVSYSVNLAAVSLVAMGCTIQQSSFYGFASMLPKQYTQAVMAGESVAGLLVSSNRVLTKLLIKSDRLSTVIFFLTSTVYIAFSYVLHTVTTHSPFVRYHMKACAKIILRPDEDHVLTETIDGQNSYTNGGSSGTGNGSASGRQTRGSGHSGDNGNLDCNYGILSLETTGNLHHQPTQALSFSNPVYELSNPTAGESSLESQSQPPNMASEISSPTPTIIVQDIPNVAFKVEHIITPMSCNPGRLGNFKSGLESRWRVAHAIYPYMACIALAYCVTLSLYPGIESEIISCSLGNWMPVLLMFTFNLSDVLGKVLAAVPYNWSRRQLVLMSGLRALLVPLLLLCCAPRARPVIAGESAAFIFTAALGITNGLAGSLPMILAPAKVPSTLKEITGNMMTLSYNLGLTVGSLVGYVFDSMLGKQLTNPCPVYPFIPKPPPTINTSTTLLPTTFVVPLATTILTTISTTSIPFISSTLSASSASLSGSSLAAASSISTLASSHTNLLQSMIDEGKVTTAVYNATQFLLNATYDNINSNNND